MNNKGIGAIFCLMAALLMAARYMAAAIFMSGISSWNVDLFQAGLECVGPALPIAGWLALIVGVIFLGVGIYEDRKGKAKE